MKCMFFSAAALLLSSQIALACNDAPGPENVRAFHEPNFSGHNFAKVVTDAFSGEVMGYSAVLRGPNGEVVSIVNYGWARTDCETAGAQRFNAKTITNWASSSKVVTAAAILDKIERFPATRSLDERLIDHFPNRWPVGNCTTPGSCWSEATIGHALSHRAGFVKGVNTPWEQRFSSGTTERPVGSRAYANENFAIFEYMGSFLAAAKMETFENANTQGNLSAYSQAVRTEVRSYWQPYLQKYIFKPAEIDATCADVRFKGDNYAMAYATIDDRSRGWLSTPDKVQTCTTGGMVMSVMHMTKFLWALANTDDIISNDLFESEMVRSDRQRLGFDQYIDLCDRLESLDIELPANRTCNGWWALTKNGASRGKIGTEILVFHDGSTVAFARNSGWTDPDAIEQRETLIEAYLRARWESGPRRTNGG